MNRRFFVPVRHTLPWYWQARCLWIITARQHPERAVSIELVIVGFALLFRLVMALLPAIDCRDFERHLFDAQALGNGLNSYAIVPLEHPELNGDGIIFNLLSAVLASGYARSIIMKESRLNLLLAALDSIIDKYEGRIEEGRMETINQAVFMRMMPT